MIRPPPISTLFPYTTLFRSTWRIWGSTPSSTAARNRQASSRPTENGCAPSRRWGTSTTSSPRSEEHTSELQSRQYLVCRLLLEKKKKNNKKTTILQTTLYYH